MTTLQPPIEPYAAAGAQLLDLAYRIVGGDAHPLRVAEKLGELVSQAADAAEILRAATWSPDEDKYPQTVVGVLESIDGGCLHWCDDSPGRDARKAFAGSDMVSRAALRTAARLIQAGNHKAWISYGYIHGKGKYGETEIRRLMSVRPFAAAQQRQNGGGRPELSGVGDDRPGPSSPPPDDGFVPPPARHDPAAPPQRPQAVPDAAPAADLCDGASDALYEAHALAVRIRGAGPDAEATPLGEKHYQVLTAALEDMDRRANVALRKAMAYDYDIRDIARPATAGELATIIEAIVQAACGQAA